MFIITFTASNGGKFTYDEDEYPQGMNVGRAELRGLPDSWRDLQAVEFRFEWIGAYNGKHGEIRLSTGEHLFYKIETWEEN